MIKEGKFGIQEAIFMLIITISSKIFFVSPALLAKYVGTAAWCSTIISDIGAIFAFTIIYLLLKRFPGKNIIEIFDSVMGRIFGFTFSFVFAVLFLYSSSILLREFVEVLRVYIFPEAYSSILEGVFVLTVVIASFLGLESIARISKLFGYILLFFFITILMLNVKNLNYHYLFPILGHGFNEIIIHGLKRSSAYSEVVVIAVFAGSLHGIKDIKKTGYISLVLSGLIFATVFLFLIMIYPYFSLQELTAPFYVMTRGINYGIFFQRLDPIFLILWIMSIIIAVSVLFFSAVSTYCKIFRLQDSKPIIIPMAVILFALTMAPKDFTSLVYGPIEYFREYGWIIFYGLPLIALVTAVIREKKGEV